MPTICAILINYNHGEYVGQALNDLLSQRQPFDEILVVDDASTDHSVEVIKSFANQKKIRFIQNAFNKGSAEAINTGLKFAKSDFIYIASSSNRYNNFVVPEFKRLISLYPNTKMISGNICVHHESDFVEYQLPFPADEFISSQQVKEAFREKMHTFFGGGNILQRTTLLNTNLFRPELKWHSDWYVYLMLGITYGVVVSSKTFSEHRHLKRRFSNEMHNKASQRPVTKFYLKTISEKGNEHFSFLRERAIIPYYSIDTILFILRQTDFRSFVTLRLVLICLSYRIGSALLKRLSPRTRLSIRRLIRL